jgi:hypothetical protein
MTKIALVVENAKELNDYILVLNNLQTLHNIKVYIIYLAEIYQDKKQDELLKNINFQYEILKIKNIYTKPFKTYSMFEKIRLVRQNIKDMFDFIQECNLLLSGVQTIFERVLYSQISKHKLPVKAFVYHRHLLFDDTVNTSSSKLVHNSIIYGLFSIFNLDGFLIEKKAVGFADKYLVLGDINKSYLIEKGIDATKIVTVGSLEYDDIESSVLKSDFNISNPKICYITSACEWIGDTEGEEYQKEKIDNFLNYCQKENLKDIIIRLHPREDFEKYEQLKEKYNFIKLQYPSNTKLLEDLQEFDVIVGGFSTVLFEVMLINKKVIFYTLEEEKYRYKSLIDNFTLPYITSMDDFKEELQQSNIINGSKFITYDKNEKAIDRIVALLEKELNV